MILLLVMSLIAMTIFAALYIDETKHTQETYRIQYKTNIRIFLQIGLHRCLGAGVSAVIGRVIVDCPVMQHPDAGLLQLRRQPIPYCQHIVVGI